MNTNVGGLGNCLNRSGNYQEHWEEHIQHKSYGFIQITYHGDSLKVRRGRLGRCGDGFAECKQNSTFVRKSVMSKLV